MIAPLLLMGALAAAPCASLTSFTAPDITITSAEVVPAGTSAVSPRVALPAFCRVAAVLKPSSDSHIEMELWLPENWNGKFQAVGNGGWAGTISLAAMATALREGTRPRPPTPVTRAGPHQRSSRSAIPRSWSTSATARSTR